jgi:hypothetical protein
MGYKVLTDGNGSNLIRVVGMGDYMPLSAHQAVVQECEVLQKALTDVTNERDNLAANVNALKDGINKCVINNVALLYLAPELKQLVAATPSECLKAVRMDTMQTALTAVANQYQGDDTTNMWCIGANHVFHLFGRHLANIKQDKVK